MRLTLAGVNRRPHRTLPFKLVSMRDWTAGLDLVRDHFLLPSGNSPDMMNIEINPSGGFCQRKVIKQFHPDPATGMCNMMGFEKESGDDYLILDVGGNVQYIKSGPNEIRNALPINATSGSKCWNFIESNFKMYASNGTDAPWCWDGDNAPVQLNQNWNTSGLVYPDAQDPNNINPPSINFIGGSMPIGCYMAVWHGHTWLANTYEEDAENPGSFIRHCNRLRFSFPMLNLKGETDWREPDYMDIDIGKDGDCITGILSCGGKLMIFKNHSVHEVAGYSPADFAVSTIMDDVGAAGPNAFACNGATSAWYDSAKGVYVTTSGGVVNASGPVESGILNCYLSEDKQFDASKVALGFHGNDLWVSLPNGISYIQDQRTYAWRRYSLNITKHLNYNPSREQCNLPLAILDELGCNQVIILERAGDNDYYCNAEHPIKSYFVTTWFNGGEDCVKKDYCCIDIEMNASGATVNMSTFVDYNLDKSIMSSRFEALESDKNKIVLGGGDTCTPLPIAKKEKSKPGAEPVEIIVSDDCPVLCFDGEEQHEHITVRSEKIGCAFESVAFRFTSSGGKAWCIHRICIKYKTLAVRC